MTDVPVWPGELPQRVLAGDYARTYGDAVQSTSMDAGVPKTRLKTTATTETVQCSIEVEAAGLARFRRFYREETARGSKPFILRDQALDGALLMTGGGTPLTTGGGASLELAATWLAMFMPGSPPREGDNRGTWFRLSFPLLILP